MKQQTKQRKTYAYYKTTTKTHTDITPTTSKTPNKSTTYLFPMTEFGGTLLTYIKHNVIFIDLNILTNTNKHHSFQAICITSQRNIRRRYKNCMQHIIDKQNFILASDHLLSTLANILGCSLFSHTTHNIPRHNIVIK